jgi:prepilin signal peptidase PulO-like enzyme (type II secretory pathway)
LFFHYPENALAWFWLASFVVIGLCLGSFISAIIDRTRKGQSFITTKNKNAARSACPACGHTLQSKDLVPLFSWIVQKGRCRYCRAAIPGFYPLLEISSAAYAVGIFLLLGFSVSAFFFLAAWPFVFSYFFLLVRDKTHHTNLFVSVIFILLVFSLYQILYFYT